MTRIIIDSTIDLPEQYRRQVHIVPLTIHFGTEELLDGVDIDRQRFYERLVESDVLPTTSQPSPDAFAQLFDQVEAAGDSAVVLTISHKLSGTYQSACIAAEGRESIFVVDTMSASIGSGILARYAIDNAHLPAGELIRFFLHLLRKSDLFESMSRAFAPFGFGYSGEGQRKLDI